MTCTRKLFLLHLVANALLLWLGYDWLGVGESTRLRLAWSGLDALAILALVCWFHGATLVFFRKHGELKINEAFRAALRQRAGAAGGRGPGARTLRCCWLGLPAPADSRRSGWLPG